MSKYALAILMLLPGWMTGTWRSTTPGGAMSEEVWSSAEGTLMTGMHRDVRPDKPTRFEFLRIEKRGEDLVYVAMPGGGPATEFRATSATESKITFENPRHDFPKRIRYWREGTKLCAAIDDGTNEKAQRWCWEKVP